MPRTRSKIPRSADLVLSKQTILQQLTQIDNDTDARARVLQMDTDFQQKIKVMCANLPVEAGGLRDINTSPFVLMAHTYNQHYTSIQQLEDDIILAKVFSSMETSIGKMVEQVALPVYNWNVVPSQMHTPYSVVDGKKIDGEEGRFVTLKSGPRCINDDQVTGISDAFVANYRTWAKEHGICKLKFDVGILYGTCKQSMKKDWHIIDESSKKLPNGVKIGSTPDHSWHFDFKDGKLDVDVGVKIGANLWRHIGGQDYSYLEVCVALVRACVPPTPPTTKPATSPTYRIPDLQEIASMGSVPIGYNVGILQVSQLPWLFLVCAHFCDRLVETNASMQSQLSGFTISTP